MEHYNSKHFIARNIQSCAFAIEKCTNCNVQRCFVSRVNGCSTRMHDIGAEVEKRIQGTNRVADVLMVHTQTHQVLAAVEVKHTHAVDSEKWRDCRNAGVKVLEVTTKEVLRVQGMKHAKGLLMVLEVVDMKMKLCHKCEIEVESMQCMQSQIEVWNNYDKLWELYCSKMQLGIEIRILKERRTAVIRQGIIQAELALVQRNQAVFESGRQCMGKCRACNGWMFRNLRTISSQCMSEYSWNQLFLLDEKKYRKPYFHHINGYNSITVHSGCSTLCKLCLGTCITGHIAKYGICYNCNVGFNSKLRLLEDKLLGKLS